MTWVRERPRSDRRPEERAGEARPAPVGLDAVLALQRGAGNAAVAGLLQRYKYETHGETITYNDTVKDDGPYDPSTKANLKLQDASMAALPQAERVYESAQTGVVEYLEGALTEAPKVIEIAQRILSAVAAGEERSFMLGVVETLDGEIRAASSGSQAGAMADAVRALNKIHALAVKGRKEPDEEQRSRQEKEAIEKDPGAEIHTFGPDYTGLAGEFGHLTPKKHTKAEDEGTLVIKGHVNCAAPQLLAHQLKTVQTQHLHVHLETAALDVKNMTEIYFGRDEWGVMVDGVRYHHRQTVPSCDKCVENLKVVVYKTLRDAIAAQIEDPGVELQSVEADPGEAQGSAGIRERREKREMLEAKRPTWAKWRGLCAGLLDDAEDALAPQGTNDLVASTVRRVRTAAAFVERAEMALWTESWHPNEFKAEFIDKTPYEQIRASLSDALALLKEERKPGPGGRRRQPEQAIPLALQKLEQIRSLQL